MAKDELIDQFLESSRTMHRACRVAFQKVLGDNELSPAQIGILFFLSHKQPMNGQSIASEMMITRSAVTQHIDALCQTGYAAKVTDKDDRRVLRIELTAKGTQKLKQFEKARKTIFTHVTATFTDQELQAAVAFNNKMLEELNKWNSEEVV